MSGAAAAARTAQRIPLSYVAVLVPVMAALNIVGGFIISIVKVPIFLDMIGTMVVSVALGPWWGALTGIITNTAGSLVNGPVGIPFALCNVVGALVWGYGIRSFGLGKSLPGLIAVGAICGVAVQAMAAPIITFVFGGATGPSSDALVAAISAAGLGTLQASFIGGLPGSFADKLIATFVGLAILQALPSGLTAGVGLPKTDQNGVLKYVFIGLAVGIAFLLIAIQQAGAAS
jgi:energy-coupling factor transport system substrate-specific component